MSKPKNRDIKEKEKKDVKVSFRTSEALLETLKNKTRRNTSAAIEKAIISYIEANRKPETDYKCCECRKKIFQQEIYYCNLDQSEMRLEDEIIIIKSEPTNILCGKCVKKNKEIKKFMESEDEGPFTKIRESER
jgi:hypothetical protein